MWLGLKLLKDVWGGDGGASGQGHGFFHGMNEFKMEIQ